MGRLNLLKASAGSGKTFRLVYEYIKYVVREPYAYRHILAVTFTNKATEEMKSRIISELDRLSNNANSPYLDKLLEDTRLPAPTIIINAGRARSLILHDYSRFSVMTIDRFFQRILRSFLKEMGIDLHYELELRTDEILNASSEDLIDRIQDDDKLRKWISAYAEEKITDNRKWDIKSSLIELGTELFREKFNKENLPDQTDIERSIVKMTNASEKIKAEMVSEAKRAVGIVSSAGLSLTDFAGGQRSFAKYFEKIASGEIVAYGAGVSSALLSEDKWAAKASPHREAILSLVPELQPILTNICNLYDTNSPYLSGTELAKKNYRVYALLKDLLEKIGSYCREQGLLPISETGGLIRKLIDGNEIPFIYEKTGNYYSVFLIDEFQDTSLRQWENFIPLLHNAVSQSDDIAALLVGDIKQSIYRWRGGDWRILSEGVISSFPDTKQEVLTDNYRSSENIIRFNNAIISQVVQQGNELINSELKEAHRAGAITEGTLSEYTDILKDAYTDHEQRCGSANTGGGYVTVTKYEKEDVKELKHPFIERIEDLQERGYRPGDIAVLVRYNAEGIELANLLLQYKLAHPASPYSYDVVTQESLLVSSSCAVNFVIACFNIMLDRDTAKNAVIFNTFKNGTTAGIIPEKDIELLHGLRYTSPEEAFETININYRLSSHNNSVAYLQALHDLLITHGRKSPNDLLSFLQWWEKTSDRHSVSLENNSGSMVIMSIHKSKGLEFKTVVIPFCNWKLTPSNNTVIWSDGTGKHNDIKYYPIRYTEKMRGSSFAGSYFEETLMSYIDGVNLFYVAVTRARQELHIMVPQSKRVGRSIDTLFGKYLSEPGTAGLDGAVSSKYLLHGSIIEFGCRNTYPSIKDKEIHPVIDFSSFPISNRVRIRNKRYDMEVGKEEVSTDRRHLGTLLHLLFESSDSLADIHSGLENMLKEGTISISELSGLKKNITDSFSDGVIAGWFDGTWEQIRKESDIIIPGSGRLRRPDRVMLKGSKAVVVDYKFGLATRNEHTRQLHKYSQLLHQMGYKEVEGYIWYVLQGELVRVS